MNSVNFDTIAADDSQRGSLDDDGHEDYDVERIERQRRMLAPVLRKWGEGYIHMDDMNVKIDPEDDSQQDAGAAKGEDKSRFSGEEAQRLRR